jgi:hypothetical protein
VAEPHIHFRPDYGHGQNQEATTFHTTAEPFRTQCYCSTASTIRRPMVDTRSPYTKTGILTTDEYIYSYVSYGSTSQQFFLPCHSQNNNKSEAPAAVATARPITDKTVVVDQSVEESEGWGADGGAVGDPIGAGMGTPGVEGAQQVGA